MKRKNVLFALSVTVAAILFASGVVSAADYSDPGRWLELPAYTSTERDVFYLYPSVCSGSNAERAPVVAAHAPEMRDGARDLFEERAEALDRMGDVYAPYYAQVAADPRSLSPAERRKLLEGAPKRDVLAAFDYYVNTYNFDRPFILVGECQGAELLLALISEYIMGNASVRGRMVAAYIADHPVTEEYLRANPHLRLVQGSDGWKVLLPGNREVAGLRQ